MSDGKATAQALEALRKNALDEYSQAPGSDDVVAKRNYETKIAFFDVLSGIAADLQRIAWQARLDGER